MAVSIERSSFYFGRVGIGIVSVVGSHQLLGRRLATAISSIYDKHSATYSPAEVPRQPPVECDWISGTLS